MFYVQDDFLSPENLERFRTLISRMSFQDGKITNPTTDIKNNLEASPQTQDYQAAAQLLSEVAFSNEAFMQFAMPCRMIPPLIAKYEPGMTYGDHTDSPLLPGKPPVRSDVSMTVFINEPDQYEGGELCIHMGNEDIIFKGKAGSVVSYPTTALHGVKPVTKGQRLVVVTFFQSRIRDPLKREILNSLCNIEVNERKNLSRSGMEQLDYVRSNLIRRWVEL